MINVRLRDTNWIFEGEKVVPRFQTSFRWFGLVYPGPDQDLGKARAWLQRLKSNGFHGGRMFMELESHADMPGFWGGRPRVTPWNLRQSTSSAFCLSPEQRQAIERAIDMHVEEGVVSEWVINATIKESPGCLNKQWDRTVRYWERMQRVTMQFLREIGASNIWMENTNEWDAHTHSKVLDTLADENLLNYMARRARNEDFPNMPYGMSTGGTWDINYNVHSDPRRWAYSHVNVHSPREHGWWNVKNQIKNLFRTYNVPAALNENMFLTTKEQWQYWVTQGNYPGLASKATRDFGLMQEQVRQTLDAGAGYCLHNMNGVYCDPDLPLDEMEIWFAKKWGSEPVAGGPFDHIINQAYQEILERDADQGGVDNYNRHMLRLLEQGKNPEVALRQSLLASGEYRAKYIE